MKNLVLTFSLAVACVFSAKSQDYYHGIGGQYDFALFTSTGSTDAVSVPGIVYKSTLSFGSRGASFALSAYPFAGFFLSNGDGFVGAELPVLGEIYFGDADDMCFYAGAGFSGSFFANGYTSGAILGPQAGLGGQFYIADRLWGVRAAYTHGVNGPELSNGEREKRKIFSLGVYYMLGQ